ncbi:MAG: iron chaperone [Nocardioidaceae bacterium]
MSAADIDGYLLRLDEPHCGTLEEMRRRILLLIPDAEQGISYAVPAFKVRGKTVAGLAAFKDHLSYLPHSGSVLPALAEQLTGYTQTKSALHFAVDQPLPPDLIRKLLDARRREAGLV